MAFINKPGKSLPRLQFENRLEKCGLKSSSVGKYKRWFLTSYLIIRTFDEFYTIHTNVDTDTYEVLKRKYDNVNYECKNSEFLIKILLEGTKKMAERLKEVYGDVNI